jgi:hypothetical protein
VANNSPTQRTMKVFRDADYRIDVVERFISAIKQRRDYMHFGDLMAYTRNVPGVLAIQATSTPNLAARMTKCTEGTIGDAVRDWLWAGNRLECWGWSLKGKRRQRKLWTPTVRRILLGGRKGNEFYYTEESEVFVAQNVTRLFRE